MSFKSRVVVEPYIEFPYQTKEGAGWAPRVKVFTLSDIIELFEYPPSELEWRLGLFEAELLEEAGYITSKRTGVVAPTQALVDLLEEMRDYKKSQLVKTEEAELQTLHEEFLKSEHPDKL